MTKILIFEYELFNFIFIVSGLNNVISCHLFFLKIIEKKNCYKIDFYARKKIFPVIEILWTFSNIFWTFIDIEDIGDIFRYYGHFADTSEKIPFPPLFMLKL